MGHATRSWLQLLFRLSIPANCYYILDVGLVISAKLIRLYLRMVRLLHHPFGVSPLSRSGWRYPCPSLASQRSSQSGEIYTGPVCLTQLDLGVRERRICHVFNPP
jgi:hypothetical protein